MTYKPGGTICLSLIRQGRCMIYDVPLKIRRKNCDCTISLVEARERHLYVDLSASGRYVTVAIYLDL